MNLQTFLNQYKLDLVRKNVEIKDILIEYNFFTWRWRRRISGHYCRHKQTNTTYIITPIQRPNNKNKPKEFNVYKVKKRLLIWKGTYFYNKNTKKYELD